MADEGHMSPCFIQYPAPKTYDIPHKVPVPAQNPVVKGVALPLLSSVVTSIPFVSSLLYANAGFSSLRKVKELDDIEPRYDPAVIPASGPGGEPYSTLGIEDAYQRAEGDGFHTIGDFYDQYKHGTLTPTDVIETLLPLIRRDVQNRTPHSTAFVDSKADLVRRAAEESTRRWKENRPLGLLDGVPFAVKDEMDVKGYRRYVGTKKDFTDGEEVETSWCVKKLEEQGAIIVGKCNMHEVGLDVTNNNPIWGTPRNPYNERYYTGGSSGGSAYAVASGIVPFAIGADGGGSIRIPSNFCGLYGLKPSHGRVSIAPTACMTNTTTVQGPLAANMASLAVSFRVLAQPDPANPVSSQFAVLKEPSSSRIKKLGICKSWFDRADPIVQEHCHSSLRYMTTELGYELIDITLPMLHEGQLAHAMTILCEAATAYPDISFLTPANKILLKVAQQTPATDLLLAQRVRNLIMQHLAYLFKQYPGLIIVTPTTPNAGWPINEAEISHGFTDGNTQMRTMEYVWLANFTGLPCIQFPVGYAEPKHGEGKVPLGMMGHGEWGSEEELIAFGFDGETWLHKGYKEGRRMPARWVDVLKDAGKR
ncbi:amidase signature enzyme [Westerdykella ornata]|uniref:Amidase signature enzyme n=1 Tax=Westerdykella ornata TaxID=318751 RepID=A0A6A6JPV6_WESOR|nr:amidase signature enzyme [Westerdykella ornata]KAF2276989.1 amidase signature enzyme [Westerdykella ornata]